MDQINETGGGSKKGLYIVIVILVILAALYFLRGSFGMMGAPYGTDINRNLDGSATYSNDEGTVTVGSNRLPENWPSDAPTYSNATIQYSGSSNPQTGAKGSAVVFTTFDSVQNVVDFYRRELVSNGWTVEQTATIGASTVLAARKDTRTLGVYIAEAGNGQVSVTVGIEMPNSQ